MEVPRILVTGAKGFLGTHIVTRARATGNSVVAAYRGASSNSTVPMDVRDDAAVEAAFRSASPSIVIHCASYGVNYSDQDLEQAFTINTRGSLTVLRAAARHGVTRFVHLGSCFEYGHHNGPISEDAPLAPSAIYGATKAAASVLLRERAKALGIRLIIARPFGIWGPGEPPYRLLPQVITACLTRQPLDLTSCEVIRDYMYVEDVAERVVALALTDSDTIAEPDVNIGSGRGILLREFVLSVARLLNGEALMNFGRLQPRPTEMASLVANIDRLRYMVGDQTPTALVEGVRRMVKSIDPSGGPVSLYAGLDHGPDSPPRT